MPLTPEQREAWEREKAEREQRLLEAEEALSKRKAAENKIEEAIRAVERKEKRKKILVGIAVLIYIMAAAWYFLIR